MSGIFIQTVISGYSNQTSERVLRKTFCVNMVFRNCKGYMGCFLAHWHRSHPPSGISGNKAVFLTSILLCNLLKSSSFNWWPRKLLYETMNLCYNSQHNRLLWIWLHFATISTKIMRLSLILDFVNLNSIDKDAAVLDFVAVSL